MDAQRLEVLYFVQCGTLNANCYNVVGVVGIMARAATRNKIAHFKENARELNEMVAPTLW